MRRKRDAVGLYRDAAGCVRAWFIRGCRLGHYRDVSLVSIYRLTSVMQDLRDEFRFRPDSYGHVGWVAERRPDEEAGA